MSNQFNRESDRQTARMNPEFIQMGIVKDNRDPQKMGRLKVWLDGSASAEDNKTGWITCDYATPFGGRTQGSPNAKTYDEFPKSYGFWAVPPDVGTRVFVFFVNGRIEQSYWFGCSFDHHMNHQVPGPHTKVMGESTLRTPYPVVEFDRNTSRADPDNQYVNVPLVDSLQRQNLLYDTEKGTPDRSARRQAPATMYGMSSPRGNHFVIDDGFVKDELVSASWDEDQDSFQNTEYGNPANNTVQGERKHEGIVLRTRSGAQILISESEGNVFIINRDGTARIEMDKDGNVSILGDQDVSIRAKRDINYYAERDMNIETLGNLNIKVHGQYKTEVMKDTHNLHHGEVVTDVDKSLRLYTKETIRLKSDGTLNAYATGDLSLESAANVGAKGGSAVKLEAAGGKLTLAGNVSVSNNIMVGADVKTAKVSLNNHVHRGIQGGPGKTQPAEMGGGGNSASSAPQPEPADDVIVAPFEAQTHEDVIDVNPDETINKRVLNDIGQRPDKSLSALCFVMPCSGNIASSGYWGKGVIDQSGTSRDNTGWSIEISSDIVSIGPGFVRERSDSHVIIDHKNGYMSVYRGFSVFATVVVGAEVSIGETIGQKGTTPLLFEVRKSGAPLYGFQGTVDPGLFFIETTGTQSDAGGVALTSGTATNPISATGAPATSQSEVVKLVEIKSIVSLLPLSGSTRQPQVKTVAAPVQQKRNNSTVELDNSQPVKKAISPAPVDWVVSETDNEVIDELKVHEGSIDYQQSIGTYSAGKFFPYKDILGYWTIGYGHLIRANEDYRSGLETAGVDALLAKDVRVAVIDAKAIAESYNMRVPRDAQVVLTEMVFQLGRAGTMGFKRMLRALANEDYTKAAEEMKNSDWYRQTPGRVDIHINKLKAL